MRRMVIAVPIALSWLLMAAVTRAQSPSADDPAAAQAAVRFQQGVELFREGSYEGALAEFRKAYQIRPSYRVLYNIAQAQYALHDFVGAYKSLRQYMAEGAGDVGAERQVQVDEMLAKLEDRIAHLQISTNVSGADIRVNDVSVGTSPLAEPVPVNVGACKVSAFKAGAPMVVRSLTVAGRETVNVELHLDVPVVALARSPSEPVALKTEAPTTHRRTVLIVSASTTAALAIGTGIFGYLALSAQSDLKDQVNTYPNTKDRIDDARAKSRRYGYVADAFGAATLAAAGVSLYLFYWHGGDSSDSRRADKSVALSPTPGGMVLQGAF